MTDNDMKRILEVIDESQGHVRLTPERDDPVLKLKLRLDEAKFNKLAETLHKDFPSCKVETYEALDPVYFSTIFYCTLRFYDTNDALRAKLIYG